MTFESDERMEQLRAQLAPFAARVASLPGPSGAVVRGALEGQTVPK